MKGLKPRFLLKVLGSHDGFSSGEAGGKGSMAWRTTEE